MLLDIVQLVETTVELSATYRAAACSAWLPVSVHAFNVTVLNDDMYIAPPAFAPFSLIVVPVSVTVDPVIAMAPPKSDFGYPLIVQPVNAMFRELSIAIDGFML